MRVIFPNPFGYPLPQRDQVLRLKEQHHFSDGYTEFLLSQNGFCFASLAGSENPRQFMGAIDADLGNESELKVLYGLVDREDAGLEQKTEALSMFGWSFIPIGEGYSGNDYVEVLRGKFAGYVASLDHKMYGACSDLDEFLDAVGRQDLSAASPEALTDALTDPGLGLVSMHATSMREFIANCVHCDDQFKGYVLDSKSLGSESWGLFD